MLLIVGLGNPGEQYKNTRHNAGFLALDQLAQDIGEPWSTDKEARAEIIETNVNGKKVILIKPQTFMNNAGEAVQSLVARYNIPTCSVWVVYDEATLAFGTLRVRLEGSSGGHNGVKSIIQHMNAEDFVRLRIGVGEPPEQMALEDWVLSKFSKEEQAVLPKITEHISQKLQDAITTGSLENITENLSE